MKFLKSLLVFGALYYLIKSVFKNTSTNNNPSVPQKPNGTINTNNTEYTDYEEVK